MVSSQQPNDSNRSGGFRSTIDAMGAGLSWVSQFIDDTWVKINNLTQTNYDLACRMVHEGRIDDAIFRFKVTLWLAPGHILSMYNLGCLYEHKGLRQQALEYYKKILKVDPKHEAALYMVATLDPSLLKADMRPTYVPLPMIVEYFDQLAAGYDVSMQQTMYKLPALTHQLLHQHIDERFEKRNLLDLGCGTGLAGAQFREEFVNVFGVDLSPRMLEIANTRFDRRGVKIYARLVQQDIRVYMNSLQTPVAQVALAISVLPYIGMLDSFFAGLQRALVLNGFCVLSFDLYKEPGGYGVLPETGYFGHHPDYVKTVAEKFGFDLLRMGEVEANAGKRAELCIFRKNSEQVITETSTPSDDSPSTSA